MNTRTLDDPAIDGTISCRVVRSIGELIEISSDEEDEDTIPQIKKVKLEPDTDVDTSLLRISTMASASTNKSSAKAAAAPVAVKHSCPAVITSLVNTITFIFDPRAQATHDDARNTACQQMSMMELLSAQLREKDTQLTVLQDRLAEETRRANAAEHELHLQQQLQAQECCIERHLAKKSRFSTPSKSLVNLLASECPMPSAPVRHHPSCFDWIWGDEITRTGTPEPCRRPLSPPVTRPSRISGGWNSDRAGSASPSERSWQTYSQPPRTASPSVASVASSCIQLTALGPLRISLQPPSTPSRLPLTSQLVICTGISGVFLHVPLPLPVIIRTLDMGMGIFLWARIQLYGHVIYLQKL